MKNLESLYSEYLATGTCDAEAFLDLKSQSGYLERLTGKKLGLRSKSEITGTFVCLELRFQRPTHFSELGFFIEAEDGVQMLKEPLEFLESCEEEVMVEQAASESIWTSRMHAEVSAWVRARLTTYEQERELEFNEDLEKLREYFREFASEMEGRKKTIFFHNYFFEKEAKLKEEFAHMVEDLSEQGKNLNGRYKTILDMRVLFWGVVS